ncbi:MAG: hypothetical protein AAF517_24465, partial [Planctomycetota bacterium]
GRGSIRTLSGGWVSLPLPFRGLKLKSVLVGGVPAGTSTEKGTAKLLLRGKGLHEIRFEASGTVESLHANYRISATLLGGLSTTIRCDLPAGAELLDTSVPRFSSTSGDTGLSVASHLGSGATFDLRWHLPGASESRASQIESKAWNLLRLTLDGYDLLRSEVVSAPSEALSKISYDLPAGLDVRRVVANELAEWSVESAEDGTRTLDLKFHRALAKAEIELDAWAPLATGAQTLAAPKIRRVSREENYFGLLQGARRRWSPSSFENARQTTLAGTRFRQGLGNPELVYQVFGSGAETAVAAILEQGRSQVTTSALVAVESDRVVIDATSKFNVTNGSGPTRIEIVLPAGYGFARVSADPLIRWESTTDDSGVRATLYLGRRLASGDEIAWFAESDSSDANVSLPRIALTTIESELRSHTVELAVAAAESVDIAFASAATGLSALGREQAYSRTARPGTSMRFAFRSTSSVPNYSLTLTKSVPTSPLSGTVVSVARASDAYLNVTSRLVFRSPRGGHKDLRFLLPQGAELLSAQSTSQRVQSSETRPDGTLVHLELISPFATEHAVDVEHRLPLPTGNDAFTLQPLVPYSMNGALASVDHYVVLVKEDVFPVLVSDTTELARVSSKTLPYLPEALPEDRSESYRALAAGWKLTLQAESRDSVTELQSLADLLEIESTVLPSGAIRSRAVFTTRNHQDQFLRVRLPEGAILWGVTLNGRSVLVSKDDGGDTRQLRIPLEFVGSGDLDLEVALTYEQSTA